MGYTHAHTKIGRNMKLQLGCLWHLKLAAYTNMVCKIFLDLQILNSATNVGRKVQYKLAIHKEYVYAYQCCFIFIANGSLNQRICTENTYNVE